MGALNEHWTERDVESFLYRIASDFVRHLEDALDRGKISRGKLAQRLGVSQGRISQVLNDPGNLTLKQIIKYSRALGEKVAIVSYDDGDPQNTNGPIAAEIFARCWEDAGGPTDFYGLESVETLRRISENVYITKPGKYMLAIDDLEDLATTSQGGE